MDFIEETYQELDSYYIKKEEDEIEYIEFKNDSKNWNSTAKRIIFERDPAKCGEVMVASEGTFTFICSLCLQPFNELHSFGCHIRDRHMKFESNDQAVKREKALDPLSAFVEATKLAPLEAANVDDFKPNTDVAFLGHETEDTARLDSDVDIDDRDQNFEELNLSNEISSSDEYAPPNKKVSKAHASNKKESFCVFCGRIYKTRRAFISHLKKEHDKEFQKHGVTEDLCKENPRIITMTCKYCDKKFDDSSAFRAHVQTHTGPRRFVCPYCPKMFASTYNRKAHINTHTGERPYKCTHCPKGFSDATNLEMHIRMHLRILKYSCDYCGKRFVQSTEKKVHERTHTGEKPFQCEECGKRFISHVKLTEHGRRHKNIKNYKCEVCDKAFYNSSLLKDHMPTHTGERPFHCDICGQNFPRRKSLRAHEQLHSNEKKYICDTCGKAFAQCAGLYSHKKSHGEKPR